MRGHGNGYSLFFALAALLGVLGVAPTEAAQAKKILVGHVTITSYYWPNWVAQEKGFFKEEGVEPELITIDTTSKTTQALSANSLNVAWVSTDSPILARQKGAPIVIVGGVIERPMYDLVALPKYKSVKDLKGTTLGVSNLKAGSTLLLHYALSQTGFKFPGDYDVIEAGGTPSRLAAVKSGGVSAALITEPDTFLAEDEGFTVLARIVDLLPQYEFITIAVNTDWAKTNREALVSYMKAVIRGMQWLHNEKNRDEAARILGKYVRMQKEAYATRSYDSMFKRLKVMPADASLNAKAMDAVIDLMVANKQAPNRIPWQDSVDDSYRQAALKALGGR